MSADAERGLLARAYQLADVEDLAEEVTSILGGVRAAGLDPDATRGLAGAALALGAESLAVYRAEATRYADDREFRAEVDDTEAGVSDRAAAVARLASDAEAARQAGYDALDAASDQLEGARAMPTSGPCDGCHGARSAAIAAAHLAIADAEERIGYAEAAAELLAAATEKLARALGCLQRVTVDYSEVYEPVIDHVRAGGVMPYDGDFVTGADPAGPDATGPQPYPCAKCNCRGYPLLAPTATCSGCGGSRTGPYAAVS